MSFHSILVLASVLSQQQKVSEHINYDSTRQEDEVPNTFIYIIYLALMLINFFTIFQNFIHVYNKTWLYPLPLILSRYSHIPSICSTPNFNIFIFSNITIISICEWVGAISWCMENISMTIYSKWMILHSPTTTSISSLLVHWVCILHFIIKSW